MGLFELVGMRNGFVDLLLALGLAIAGFSGSQVYSFGALLASEVDIPITETQLNVCKGLAIIGLQMTLFAGLVLDRFGPKLTLAIGAVGNVACWVGMSFLPATDNAWIGLLLLLVLASFSQGFLFLACFKTSMQMHKTGGGVAMGLVSATMSLSLAVALFSSTLAHCEGPHCWRVYCQIFAVEGAIFGVIGFFTLLLFRESNYPWLLQNGAGEEQKLLSEVNGEEVKSVPMTLTGPDEPSSFLRSLRLFAHPYFLAMFIGYFASVGSSITTVSSGQNIWNFYTNSTADLSQDSDSFQSVASAFSFTNAASNVLTSVLAAFATAKGFSPIRYLILVLISMFVINVVMGVVLAVSARSFSLMVVLGATFASLGAGFGAILVLSAVAFGNLFGFSNFGVFFSLMQIAGSGGSVLNPIISGAIFESLGSYFVFPFMWAGLLGLAVVSLTFVPITPYKR